MLFSRWMGLDLFGELAVILTIKLAALALLNAVQIAVSRGMVEGQVMASDLAVLSRLTLLAGLLALPPTVFALWWVEACMALGLRHPDLLLILAVALPFATPLCLARGMTLGRVSVGSTILSTQIEMLVRLGLGALAWQAGFGIEGVTLAVVLSIFVGWIVICGETANLLRPRPALGAIVSAV